MKRYYLLFIIILFIFASCSKTPQDLACEALELTYQLESDAALLNNDNLKKMEKIGQQMNDLSQSELMEYLKIMDAQKCPKCNKNYKNRF